jgi:hypothetical protein
VCISSRCASILSVPLTSDCGLLPGRRLRPGLLMCARPESRAERSPLFSVGGNQSCSPRKMHMSSNSASKNTNSIPKFPSSTRPPAKLCATFWRWSRGIPEFLSATHLLFRAARSAPFCRWDLGLLTRTGSAADCRLFFGEVCLPASASFSACLQIPRAPGAISSSPRPSPRERSNPDTSRSPPWYGRSRPRNTRHRFLNRRAFH